jgi:hypothetical protein
MMMWAMLPLAVLLLLCFFFDTFLIDYFCRQVEATTSFYDGG